VANYHDRDLGRVSLVDGSGEQTGIADNPILTAPDEPFVLSTNNATTTPLAASATWKGTPDDLYAGNYVGQTVSVNFRPNVDPDGDANTAVASLYFEYDDTGTAGDDLGTWQVSVAALVRTGVVIPVPLMTVKRWFRVGLINDGGTAAIAHNSLVDTAVTPVEQTSLAVTTLLHKINHPALGRTLDQSISPSDPVQLTRSVLMGRSFDNATIRNVKLSEQTRDDDNELLTAGALLTTTAAVAFTVNAGTDVITSNAHGLSDTNLIIVKSDDTLPAGLAEYTEYYVRDATANTFKVAATSGGTAIDITDTGTGTHSWYTPGTFTGTFRDWSQVGHVIHFYAITKRPTSVQTIWSDDGVSAGADLLDTTTLTNIDQSATNGYHIGLSIHQTMIARYARVRIVNGYDNQVGSGSTLHGVFIGKDAYPGSFGALDATLSTLSSALLTRSVLAGTKPDGTFDNVILNRGKALVTSEFLLEVAQGNAAGFLGFSSKGANDNIDTNTDPEAIWLSGGLYTGQTPTAAVACEVVSSDAADASAGTGAQQIKVYGLASETATAETNTTVNLNGTTGVSLGNWFRIYRAECVAFGSGATNAGTLTVRETATPSDIFAKIPIGAGESAVGAFTVPASTTGFIVGVFIMLARASGAAGSAQVSLQVRNTGSGGYTKRRIYYATTASPVMPPLRLPIELAASDDIVWQVDSVSDNNTQVTVEWDMVLVDD
jgi:hypothetical protein